MGDNTRRPDRMVRFYGNTDFALDAVANRQITFVHVSLLNDPFDPYFYFETDFNADYDKLLTYVRKSRPKQYEQVVQSMSRMEWEQSIADVKRLVEQYRQSTFVFSCSAITKDQHPKDNLYLWGHYANGHRGVAIEFDSTEVTTNLEHHPKHELRNHVSSDEAWVKVQYKQDIGVFTQKMFVEFLLNLGRDSRRKTRLEEYLGEQPCTKSNVWRHENEWRMLWQNDETKLKIHRVQVTEKAIVAVYIGVTASIQAERDVTFEVRKKFPSAKIFRAFKKPGFSGLGFKPVIDSL